MWLELARPVTLLASVLSLLAVMGKAFFGPETGFEQRLYDTASVLLISAAISLVSGLTFHGLGRTARYKTGSRALHINETFPMLVFYWTTGIMAVIFLVSWYVESYGVFYRDVQRF